MQWLPQKLPSRPTLGEICNNTPAMHDYSRHYAILKATQDTDWKALRARYKRLIGRWHPDRFPAAPERELAEERSKQITFAYQAIERYYRENGVLPPMEPATNAESAGVVAREPGTVAGNAQPAAQARPTEHQPPDGVPRRRHAFIAIAALALATYTMFRSGDDDVKEARSAGPSGSSAETNVPVPPARDIPHEETGGISAGSTLGEVYAIQGIPTLTYGDIWEYGKSSVRFKQGKVISWTQHPDNPLRIARDQPIELREGFFDVGSTKNEVRSIQGTPLSETETVWDYGPSRVYFEHNRVVRWEASPLQPLRVPH
jgi:hypothetical protein